MDDWFTYALNPRLLDSEINKLSERQLLKLCRQFLDQSAAPQPSGSITSQLPAQPISNVSTAAAAISSPSSSGVSSGKENDPTANSQPADVLLQPPLESDTESKKPEVLEVMGLKIAAHLNFSLQRLMHKLPSVHMNRIVTRLLQMSTGSPGVDPYADLDWPGWTPAGRWAQLLYHRWALATLVEDSFLRRPIKAARGLAVPGITDKPEFYHAPSQAVVRALYSRVNESLTLLETLLTRQDGALLPTIQAFQLPEFPGGGGGCPPLFEQHCVPLPIQDLHCLAAYDLGRYYFQSRRFAQAEESFSRSQQMAPSLGAEVESDVPPGLLESYLLACRSISGDIEARPAVLKRLETSRQHRFNDITELLLSDMGSRELSGADRDRLEVEVSDLHQPKLKFEVYTCNILERVAAGHALLTEYTEVLQRTPVDLAVAFLLRVLPRAFVTFRDPGARSNLVCFLWYLVQSLPSDCGLVESVLDGDVGARLPLEDRDELVRWLHGSESPGAPVAMEIEDVEDVDSEDDWFSEDHYEDDKEEGAGCDDLRLLTSYDPEEIHVLLKRLQSNNAASVLGLCERWNVSVDLSSLLKITDKSSSSFSVEAAFVFVLVSKASILRQLEDWNNSRLLLSAAERAAEQLRATDVYRAQRLIRYDILLVDIQEFLNGGPHSPDLLKRAKQAVTAARLETDCLPSEELLSGCVAALLSVSHEWNYLTDVAAASGKESSSTPSTAGCGPLEIGALLVDIIREVEPNSKTVTPILRSKVKELWEALGRCFPPRRDRLGERLGTGRQNLTKSRLTNFLCAIRDRRLQDLLISALVRLSVRSRDDINVSIHTTYDFFPSSATPAAIHEPTLREALRRLLSAALRREPDHVDWLLTRADLAFGEHQSGTALRAYLEAGAAASDCFTRPVNSHVYHENTLRRMVRCCEDLRLCAEGVVLCQFLEEPDLATAVRLAREPGALDSLEPLLPYLFELNLVELLTALAHKSGALARRGRLQRVLSSQPELNGNNRPDLLQATALRKKLAFLQALSQMHFL